MLKAIRIVWACLAYVVELKMKSFHVSSATPHLHRSIATPHIACLRFSSTQSNRSGPHTCHAAHRCQAVTPSVYCFACLLRSDSRFWWSRNCRWWTFLAVGVLAMEASLAIVISISEKKKNQVKMQKSNKLKCTANETHQDMQAVFGNYAIE